MLSSSPIMALGFTNIMEIRLTTTVIFQNKFASLSSSLPKRGITTKKFYCPQGSLIRRVQHLETNNEGISERMFLRPTHYISGAIAASTGRDLFFSLQPCKATSDDSGAVSGESILLNEQTLERELEIAIEQENYAEAARIRDRIQVLHKDGEASVLAANARFYNAFRTGDLAAMQALWAKGDNVCCVHPGASGISGYELVMRSWEYVWVDYEFPLVIELRDVQVHVRGELGYVACVEMVKTKGNSSWGRQYATNIFEKVDGHWLICVHHASPVDL